MRIRMLSYAGYAIRKVASDEVSSDYFHLLGVKPQLGRFFVWGSAHDLQQFRRSTKPSGDGSSAFAESLDQGTLQSGLAMGTPFNLRSVI